MTEIESNGRSYLTGALYEDRKLSMLRVGSFQQRTAVGTVLKGYVASVAKNIAGAFVCTGKKDDLLFLPVGPVKKKEKRSKAGDEPVQVSAPVLVQITKDAAGIKRPVVTRNISLTGRYAVVSRKTGRMGFSQKLSDEQKELIRKWIPLEMTEEFHILIRTNAAWTDKHTLLREIESLTCEMRRILEDAKTADTGAVLYRPEPFYIEAARDAYNTPDRFFSDIPLCAEELTKLAQKTTMEQGAALQSEPIFFEQKGEGRLNLAQLYDLPRDLEKLTSKKVWLKGGGFLVIEKTEAFWSIDVNTGKCIKGRIPEETYRKVNIEAAEEIARQMRLRNLSGMILVDFISMTAADHNEELVNVMKKLVRKDHIHTDVIDLTPLGIMEIVRQKVRRPLYEELQEI